MKERIHLETRSIRALSCSCGNVQISRRSICSMNSNTCQNTANVYRLCCMHKTSGRLLEMAFVSVSCYGTEINSDYIACDLHPLPILTIYYAIRARLDFFLQIVA